MLRNDLRDVWAASVWSRLFSHRYIIDTTDNISFILSLEGFFSRKFSRFSKYMGDYSGD
jgi:hypothetical protein